MEQNKCENNQGEKMANKIELLDCTLRDGAYVVDAKFGTAAVRGMIRKMQDAGVEIIECGWLKNEPHIFMCRTILGNI